MNSEPNRETSRHHSSAPGREPTRAATVSRRAFLKSAGAAAAFAVGGGPLLQGSTSGAATLPGPGGLLQLRSQRLATDATGHAEWQTTLSPFALVPAESAIVICDMWDRHWSRGATERVGKMAPVMNDLIKQARTRGMHIVHAPSDTMPFYVDAPARKRVLAAPVVAPPPPVDRPDPLLPIDDSDGGSDTGEKPWFKAWSRQHPAIEIDQERDAISDNGNEIYSYLHPLGVRTVFVMGVHTNMCVINRTFGIKALVRWGLRAVLIRDLTDAMYNPAMRPYVSHTEGTQLVIGYIEKFWA
ncbi:MAG TPA: isochorismatase family protein, partial [Lacunisphaera sp.]|nr:isochorismatase family protein [Lacunisphaera sp.]